MKVGDLVIYKDRPSWGIGLITQVETTGDNSFVIWVGDTAPIWMISEHLEIL